MLKNYFKIAVRNLFRAKTYSLINIVGLAVGMAACITIFIFVRYENSFDSFNKKADRIYRVNVEVKLNGKETRLAIVPPSLGTYLRNQFPQIENRVRIYSMDILSSVGKPDVKYNDRVLQANSFLLVDSAFFKVFSFHMIQGDPNTALNAPFSVVLTKSAALKIFGNINPIGKTIEYNNKFHFKVTGVVQNPPKNSTIQFDYLGSLNSMPGMKGQPESKFEYYTYLLLNKNTNYKEVQQQLPQVMKGYWSKDVIAMIGLPHTFLEPLKDLYWDNSLQYDIPIKGSRSSMIAFSVIAFIILLIACFNFINLSTAQSFKRAKEIGIRKVIGGKRGQLIRQFMSESALMSLLAFLAAIALSELFIPVVKNVLGIDLQSNYISNFAIVAGIAGIWILTGLLSGIVPAFYLSKLQPISTLKGNISGLKHKGFGRQLFILFQFTAAIALIFCTIVVTGQYHLLRFHNTGFNENNILVLKYNQAMNGSYKPFKQELLENAHILGVTASDAVPGGTFGLSPYVYQSKSGQKVLQFHIASVDKDFIPVYDMKLLAGRNFSTYDRNAYILNEAAVKKIGITPSQAIGMGFNYPGQSQFNKSTYVGHVIGVASNFNFQSLRNKVEPLVLIMRNHVWMLSVKISSGDISGTLKDIEKTWKQMFPNSPLEYSFLNKDLNALYKTEENLGVLFTWFSFLAIFIACLGLYGLALNTAQRKTKEIGIRKVLGSSVPAIVMLLSEDFMKWVFISNLIAWPAAYYFMNNWLDNFAYRINVSIWYFVLAGGIALVVALATIGVHAIKAATANPVKSLRYE